MVEQMIYNHQVQGSSPLHGSMVGLIHKVQSLLRDSLAYMYSRARESTISKAALKEGYCKNRSTEVLQAFPKCFWFVGAIRGVSVGGY